MKYKRLVGINLLVLSGLLLLLTMILYFVEVHRINSFFSFTSEKQAEYFIPDATAMFVHKPNIHLYDNWGTPQQKMSTERRTNNVGFREDDDITTKQKNEFRVLVTGDSHTDGVLRYNTQSFVNIWEEKLNAADSTMFFNCMNGGVGYYTFRNYDGFLKKYTYLQPDVFLINVFAGNDFREAAMFEDNRTGFSNVYKSLRMRFRRKFQSNAQKQIPYTQGLEQLLYFESFPDEKERTMEIAQGYLLQIKEWCKQHHIRLIVTVLPSKLDTNADFRQEIQHLFKLDEKTMQSTQELTQTFIKFLQTEQIEHYDLQPLLQNATEKVYWDADLHINPKAHEMIAEFLNTHIAFPSK
ncbi:GDSL-like lipase/acylhydrolase family protein [Kordia periserrulae]|uniref:GDSL-like lipase/acylhydrolase family protein n=1 Tax=Kordia periserrulae TaxID=701523 RepID=A0A2T6C6F1_9FLAO|nr:SGNH/GDSL hydrolase family protein [Kordia periserrulae]PTX63900.1 GDSL-like lipase/acylhydrolase family protein [Kordia periserrulae]